MQTSQMAPQLEIEPPSHEIILVRAPEERQQCYDVVL